MGLSQSEVAGIIGVSEDTVRNWEGSRVEPSKVSLLHIQVFLGLKKEFSQLPTLSLG